MGEISSHIPIGRAGPPLHCGGDVVCPTGNKIYSCPALKGIYSHILFGRAGPPLHCDGDVVCPRGNKKYSCPALKDTYSHILFGRAGPPLHCGGDVVCPPGNKQILAVRWRPCIRTPLSGGQARPYIAVATLCARFQ